jgi:hypothetical protein
MSPCPLVASSLILRLAIIAYKMCVTNCYIQFRSPATKLCLDAIQAVVWRSSTEVSELAEFSAGVAVGTMPSAWQVSTR